MISAFGSRARAFDSVLGCAHDRCALETTCGAKATCGPATVDAPLHTDAATIPINVESPSSGCRSTQSYQSGDRIWLVCTRHLPLSLCNADLDNPQFALSRIDQCGRISTSSLEEYFASRLPDRQIVIYVHGNRIEQNEAIGRAMQVRRSIAGCRTGPIDWVVFSWPSQPTNHLIGDARKKAARTPLQALYMGTFLKMHPPLSKPITLVGYSFGSRVILGGLHALAGGLVEGRSLPGEPVVGRNFKLALAAPAINAAWISPCGQYRLATYNLDKFLLMYNSRDILLRNHWRLSRERSSEALGVVGPRCFAPRLDGTPLPVRAINYARPVGFRHGENNYYKRDPNTGREIAALINRSAVPSCCVIEGSPVSPPDIQCPHQIFNVSTR